MVFRITKAQFHRIGWVRTPPGLEQRIDSWVRDLSPRAVEGLSPAVEGPAMSIARWTQVRMDFAQPPEKRTSVSSGLFLAELRARPPEESRLQALNWLAGGDGAKRPAALTYLSVTFRDELDLLAASVVCFLMGPAPSDTARCHLLEALISFWRPLTKAQWLQLTHEGFHCFASIALDIANTLSRLPHMLAVVPETPEVPAASPRPRKSKRDAMRPAAAKTAAAKPTEPPATKTERRLMLCGLAEADCDGAEATNGPNPWRDHFQQLLGLRDDALAEQICQWLVGPDPAQFRAAIVALKQWGNGALPVLLEQVCQLDMMDWQLLRIMEALIAIGHPLDEPQWIALTTYILWNRPCLAADLVATLRMLPRLCGPRASQPGVVAPIQEKAAD